MYRRRRTAAVAALVVIVAGGAVVVGMLRPGASDGAPSSQGPTTPTTAATPATSSPPVPTPSITAAPKVAPSASPTPVDGSACTGKQVDVTAHTSAKAYAAGRQPQLSLTLSNTSKHSCVIDVGTAEQVYTITSGSETYWTSTDCQTDPESTRILLKAGQTLSSTPIPWDRTRSTPDTCQGTRPAAPADGAAYHVTVSVDGIASDGSTQFVLR